MSDPLKLAVFDVDGTLIDSQAHIHASMEAAFSAVGRDVPPRAEVLSIVGLSLPAAIAQLAGEDDPARLDRMVEAYKDSFVAQREVGGDAASPLYPGILSVLEVLSARDDLLLGVATGKSRRGLRHVLEMHDLGRFFVTAQVADDHPSKPHPGMLLAAVAESGTTPENSVMIGDTTFDMQMAASAGVQALAVSWGYHGLDALRQVGFDALAEDRAELPGLVGAMLGLRDE